MDDKTTLRQLLSRLPSYLENGWRPISSDAGYFGDGSSGENGVRSNSNVVFALAVLLANKADVGMSDEEYTKLSTVLRQLVHYLTASHVTGNGRCADSGRWGLSWQSSWWASKLALGADIASHLLDPLEIQAVHTLVAAEADRHLHRLIPTGLSEDTKAEETAWDAEILAVALALSPNSQSAAKWSRRLIEFGINTFSCPSDRNNNNILDGIIISEARRSCNIHEDGSLENHGASHFCYVASPLISKAWSAFALLRASLPVPDALSHNVDRVWSFAEPTFLENRFAYIGGQDWARYTYGEYFILPALPFLTSIGCGNRSGTIFRQRLNMIKMESDLSEDGSFFGTRFTQGKYFGQYAKYETDCFACVALSLEMLTSLGMSIGSESRSAKPAVVSSPEGQCCYARDHDLFMSFAWSTLSQPVPNLTFLPLSDDSLAEWHKANLLGSVKFLQPVKWIGVKAIEARTNGLRVEGSHSVRGILSGHALAEHQLTLELNDQKLQISSRYISRRRLLAALLTGLNWRIPNDVFNNFNRRYFFEGSNKSISSWESNAFPAEGTTKALSRWQRLKRKMRAGGDATPLGASKWINVDNKLGVIFSNEQNFVVRRYRQKEAPWSSLNVEQVEAPSARWKFNIQAGQTLVETECLLHLGSAEETLKLSMQRNL